jgi:tetratricopeptide (TPR) repeat protein
MVAAVDTVMGPFAEAAEATSRVKDRLAGAMGMVMHPWLSELTLLTSLPPSYEAYLALARGVDHGRNPDAYGYETAWERRDSLNAAFFRAAAFDSLFTLPLVMLHYWPWEWEGREEHFQSLQQRRDELPRWERAALDYQVAREAGNSEGMYKAAGELARMNPSADRIRVFATVCLGTNRPREALELLERLDANHGWEETWPSYWLYRAMAHQRLGEHEAALQVVDRGRGPLGPNATLDRIEVLSLVRLGRIQEATDRAVEALESARETVSINRLADITGIFWLHGLDDAADRVIPVALKRFSQRGIVEGVHLARVLVQAGRYAEARRLLERPDDLTGGGQAALHALRLLAYMAAREGDAGAANRIALTAETASVESNRAFGKMVRAEVAAQLGDKAQAMRLIQEAYAFGMGGVSDTGPNPFDFRPLKGYGPFEELIRPKG